MTSLLPSASTSLLAVYHADVPIIHPASEYAPHPLTLLTHVATTVLRVSSLAQAIEIQRAASRSLPAPEWGLGERREGVLVGLVKREREGGVVVEMEMRRRSGRSVTGKFILSPPPSSSGEGAAKGGSFMPLEDHPAFAPAASEIRGREGGEEGEPESTFDLGLTEKQRRDREGIVLPYFDAQMDIGAGEGGRILYEMGREDDFDDEEDEI